MPIIRGGNLVGDFGRARIWTGASVPVDDTTLLGAAQVGDVYSDTTNGKLYICTATNGTSAIAWTVVGTQT